MSRGDPSVTLIGRTLRMAPKLRHVPHFIGLKPTPPLPTKPRPATCRPRRPQSRSRRHRRVRAGRDLALFATVSTPLAQNQPIRFQCRRMIVHRRPGHFTVFHQAILLRKAAEIRIVQIRQMPSIKLAPEDSHFPVCLMAQIVASQLMTSPRNTIISGEPAPPPVAA